MDTDIKARVRLDTIYQPAQNQFAFSLVNICEEPLGDLFLVVQSLVRLTPDAVVEGADFVGRFGNMHEFALAGMLAPGACVSFTAQGLSHAPKHITDGPKSAYLRVGDDPAEPVQIGDFSSSAITDRGPLRRAYIAEPEQVLAITPWPATLDVTVDQDRAATYSPQDLSQDAQLAVRQITELEERLFGSRSFGGDGAGLRCVHAEGAAGGYHLQFSGGDAVLTYSTAEGLRYGLITLAQIARGARLGFGAAHTGTLTDVPAFGWRGLHVDVARHFRPAKDILRLIDICAWLKLNVLHLHLTDDEGWRLHIKSLPALTKQGAWRGPNEDLPPQHGFSDRRYGGYYTHDDVADFVARGAALGVQIMPEIDIPGHATAAMLVLPELRDPDEVMGAYRSVQGYPNPALNPALNATYGFLETVLAEVTALFPSDIIHLGGDEVPADAWATSPIAQTFMQTRGMAKGVELHAHLMRWAENALRVEGRRMGGWDELGSMSGMQNPQLFAWQDASKVHGLTQAGFDVIATPGSAYYLDMAQADGWDEPGLSWAGTVSLKDTYTYDPVAGLTGAALDRMKGVQACIWSENILTEAMFDHMVFPRLGAVAETGWTPAPAKDFSRFEKLAGLLPTLSSPNT